MAWLHPELLPLLTANFSHRAFELHPAENFIWLAARSVSVFLNLFFFFVFHNPLPARKTAAILHLQPGHFHFTFSFLSHIVGARQLPRWVPVRACPVLCMSPDWINAS
jgi:hypothetical protein